MPALRRIFSLRVILGANRVKRQFVIRMVGVLLFLLLLSIELVPLNAQMVNAQVANAQVLQAHTVSSVEPSCNRVYYSNDGNPFQLCPGSYPAGGNCVWWAWEQWHLLGYDLPSNWGNAADWIVDAERSGLSVGTAPRIGSIAVFPQTDGAWAHTSAGHVAFVTGVSSDGSTFDVTYQNYGDPKPMYVGLGYNVSVINQPDFQDGQLRFIYFPTTLDPERFAKLPGVENVDPDAIAQANTQDDEP